MPATVPRQEAVCSAERQSQSYRCSTRIRCRFRGDAPRRLGAWLTHGQVFLNIVLDDAVEEKDGGEKVRLGMVVRNCP